MGVKFPLMMICSAQQAAGVMLSVCMIFIYKAYSQRAYIIIINTDSMWSFCWIIGVLGIIILIFASFGNLAMKKVHQNINILASFMGVLAGLIFTKIILAAGTSFFDDVEEEIYYSFKPMLFSPVTVLKMDDIIIDSRSFVQKIYYFSLGVDCVQLALSVSLYLRSLDNEVEESEPSCAITIG